jgi:hypothetical protein
MPRDKRAVRALLAAVVGCAIAARAGAVVPAGAVRLGTCPDDARLAPLVLAFAPRDPAGLATVLAAQQDPTSPLFRRWLAPAEFGDRFGLPADAYEDAQRWLLEHGFTDVRTSPGRLAIAFGATAGRAAATFGVQLDAYDVGGEMRVAPAGAPVLPAFRGIAPRAVLGLDTFPRVRSHLQVSGIDLLAPADVAVVFGLDTAHAAGITGSGVGIAVLATSDFDDGAVAEFRTVFDLPATAVVKRFAATNPGTTSGTDEALLDIEWSGAAAPGAQITAEIAASNSAIAVGTALMDLVDHDVTPIISISLGQCEAILGSSIANFFDGLFQQAAAQGQSIFVASGDSGADACDPTNAGIGVDAFAASPWVTGVGGTTVDPLFDANGNATGYGGEVVWNDAGGATGGGLSVLFARPAYQMIIAVPAGSGRAVPDVAFPASPAEPGYALVTDAQGHGTVIGGTSASAPLWAGMAALLVQQRGRLGLLNPELYRLGVAQDAGGAAVFHDVTIGNNSFKGVAGFAAGPGYDLATGWGSFDAAALIGAFAGGCTTDAACNDANACTVDRCVVGACASEPAADGTACTPDECVVGACAAGACAMTGGARGDQAVECVLGNHGLADVACTDGTPRAIARQLAQVERVLAHTAGKSGRKATKILRHAGRLLAKALRSVQRNRTLSQTACGAAIADRLAFALAQLQRIEAAGG